jgi:Mitochondrial carrier protein
MYLNLRATNVIATQVSLVDIFISARTGKTEIWIVVGGLVLSIPAKLLCGGFAGAVSQSFSYPLDVTRRRMQLAMMHPETAKFG